MTVFNMLTGLNLSVASWQCYENYFFLTKLFIFLILAPQKRKLPIDGPWRHFSIKDFIKNVQEGKVETGGAHFLVYADVIALLLLELPQYLGN